MKPIFVVSTITIGLAACLSPEPTATGPQAAPSSEAPGPKQVACAVDIDRAGAACPPNTACCNGYCQPPGISCPIPPAFEGEACGPAPGTYGPTVICGEHTRCCNYHCQPDGLLCAEPEPPAEPIGESCGPAPGTDGPTYLCGEYERCCNYHCQPDGIACLQST